MSAEDPESPTTEMSAPDKYFGIIDQQAETAPHSTESKIFASEPAIADGWTPLGGIEVP